MPAGCCRSTWHAAQCLRASLRDVASTGKACRHAGPIWARAVLTAALPCRPLHRRRSQGRPLCRRHPRCSAGVPVHGEVCAGRRRNDRQAPPPCMSPAAPRQPACLDVCLAGPGADAVTPPPLPHPPTHPTHRLLGCPPTLQASSPCGAWCCRWGALRRSCWRRRRRAWPACWCRPATCQMCRWAGSLPVPLPRSPVQGAAGPAGSRTAALAATALSCCRKRVPLQCDASSCCASALLAGRVWDVATQILRLSAPTAHLLCRRRCQLPYARRCRCCPARGWKMCSRVHSTPL